MRDPKRIEKVLGLLGNVWRGKPDLRFYQLVNFLSSEQNLGEKVDSYYIEDEKLIEILKEVMGKNA